MNGYIAMQLMVLELGERAVRFAATSSRGGCRFRRWTHVHAGTAVRDLRGFGSTSRVAESRIQTTENANASSP
eukprot:653900-Pyramimonas_sp.AAC.1